MSLCLTLGLVMQKHFSNHLTTSSSPSVLLTKVPGRLQLPASQRGRAGAEGRRHCGRDGEV